MNQHVVEKENAELKRQLEERRGNRTCDLVGELEQRTGVKKIAVAPYESITVSIEGPKVLLVIED